MRETSEDRKLRHPETIRISMSLVEMDVAGVERSRRAVELNQSNKELQGIVEEFPNLKNRIISRDIVAGDGTVAVMIGQEPKRISLNSLRKMGKLLSRG